MNNQDSLAVVVTDDQAAWSNRGHLMMVADGMGAHAAGELASKLAADVVSHTYFKLRDLYPPAALRQSIREANTLIHTKGQSNIGFQGMGTTCTCLVLLPQGALVAHVGDSRVYRLRGHKLAQLTFDHSLVWEMAAAGHMAEEDVPAFIPKNVITRSLGPHAAVNIDLEGPYDTAAGDVFLLCSDGLTGQIPDVELGALLHCLTPEEAVETLVDIANLRGGPDNISVVVARIVGDGSETPTIDVARKATSASSRGSRQLLRVTTIACLFALAFCLVNKFWVAAGISAAALATSIGMLVANRNHRTAMQGGSPSLGGPYGNGPYREASCQPNQKVVDSLAAIAAQLRNLPEEKRATINWRTLEHETESAQAAAGAGDHCAAVRHYTSAIRSIMRQLRGHRSTLDDSNAATA